MFLRFFSLSLSAFIFDATWSLCISELAAAGLDCDCSPESSENWDLYKDASKEAAPLSTQPQAMSALANESVEWVSSIAKGLASPLSWAQPCRIASDPEVELINSQFTHPESSPVALRLRVEDMEQRTGVLYDNALEPSPLKYNLWIISPSRCCSLGEKSQILLGSSSYIISHFGNSFWQLKTQKSCKKHILLQLIHLTDNRTLTMCQALI